MLTSLSANEVSISDFYFGAQYSAYTTSVNASLASSRMKAHDSRPQRFTRPYRVSDSHRLTFADVARRTACLGFAPVFNYLFQLSLNFKQERCAESFCKTSGRAIRELPLHVGCEDFKARVKIDGCLGLGLA